MQISKTTAIFKDLMQVFGDNGAFQESLSEWFFCLLGFSKGKTASDLPSFVLRNSQMALDEISIKFSPNHSLWKVSTQKMAED